MFKPPQSDNNTIYADLEHKTLLSVWLSEGDEYKNCKTNSKIKDIILKYILLYTVKLVS